MDKILVLFYMFITIVFFIFLYASILLGFFTKTKKPNHRESYPILNTPIKSDKETEENRR